MRRSITMPALSASMEQGTLVRWLVHEGAEFKAGDALAEIETDKAVLTLEAPEDGTIAKILVDEGTESVQVGTPLAYLDQEDALDGKNRAELAMPQPAAAHADVAERPSTGPVVPLQTRISASPLARRLARESELDLATITGSGPGGRILGADVTRAVNVAPMDFERVSLTPMRRAIAERLAASKQSVPHAYLTVDVHVDSLMRFREELNRGMQAAGRRISVNDFIVRAMALALAQSPKVNVQFCGEHLLKFRKVDLAVAVAVDEGLLTPVIRDAGNKGLEAISLEMSELAARARARTLRPEEYSGGTACLSNLGMMGVKQFEAIINPPQAIILAVGSMEKRAAVVDDRLVIARQLTATASFDHRAMDGRDCAEFLARFTAIMEGPVEDLR